jgi:carboxyl-terminal processing protease
MVSPDAMSSGEGLPMVFAQSGRGAIVSWYGTNGAFGMEGLQAIMPLDLYVLFPTGASLNENGTIQVDSNASLSGGVAPTVRVPLNNDTITRAMAGEDVQLTYAMAWLDGERGIATPNTTATPTPKAGLGMVVVLAAIGMAVVIAKLK